jgi:hypothetical protein
MAALLKPMHVGVLTQYGNAAENMFFYLTRVVHFI